jgi:hypothetical protein
MQSTRLKDLSQILHFTPAPKVHTIKNYPLILLYCTATNPAAKPKSIVLWANALAPTH